MALKPIKIDISDEVKRCVKFLNVARHIHDHFPLNRFLYCNSWENADFPSAFPTYIFFKFKRPVINTQIETDGKQSIVAFGRIYNLLSGGVLFGYLFEFSNVKLEFKENHMAVYTQTYDEADLGAVEQLYHNPIFTIFKNNESLVVILNKHQYIKFKNKKVKIVDED